MRQIDQAAGAGTPPNNIAGAQHSPRAASSIEASSRAFSGDQLHHSSFPAPDSGVGLSLPASSFAAADPHFGYQHFDGHSYSSILPTPSAPTETLHTSGTASSLTSLSDGTHDLEDPHSPTYPSAGALLNLPPVVGGQGRRGTVPKQDGYKDIVSMEEFMAQTHVKDKDGKYCCPSCSKRYQNAKHLTRHYYTHCNERPYHCRLCGTIFTRSDVLKRHFTKCADRRNIPDHERGSHLKHTPGYTKKHGRLRRDPSAEQRILAGETPVLRSNHSRDNSAVTDGSFTSPSQTASSSRRQSLTSYDDLQPSPLTYTSNHLDQLTLGGYSHSQAMGLPSPYSSAPPNGQAPFMNHFEQATRDPNGMPVSQSYYPAPTSSPWAYSTTPNATLASANYYGHPTAMDPNMVNHSYAYSPVVSSPADMPPQSVKKDDEEAYPTGW